MRSARGAKLTAREEELFSGRVWTGRQAARLGLIDGVGDVATVLADKFGDKVPRLVDVVGLKPLRGVQSAYVLEAGGNNQLQPFTLILAMANVSRVVARFYTQF